MIGVPLIAVKYVRTENDHEDVPAGDKILTRFKVHVSIEFFDSEVRRKLTNLFQSLMKTGTEVVDNLHHSSFLYPQDPAKFRQFLEEQYAETKQVWEAHNKELPPL